MVSIVNYTRHVLLTLSLVFQSAAQFPDLTIYRRISLIKEGETLASISGAPVSLYRKQQPPSSLFSQLMPLAKSTRMILLPRHRQPAIGNGDSSLRRPYYWLKSILNRILRG